MLVNFISGNMTKQYDKEIGLYSFSHPSEYKTGQFRWKSPLQFEYACSIAIFLKYYSKLAKDAKLHNDSLRV